MEKQEIKEKRYFLKKTIKIVKFVRVLFKKYCFLLEVLLKYFGILFAIFILYFVVMQIMQPYKLIENANFYQKIIGYSSVYISSVYNVAIGNFDVFAVGTNGSKKMVIMIPFLTVSFIIFNIFFSGYLAFKFIQKKNPIVVSPNIYIREPKDKSKEALLIGYRVGNKHYEYEKLVNVKKTLELVRIYGDNRLTVVWANTEESRSILEVSTNYKYFLNQGIRELDESSMDSIDKTMLLLEFIKNATDGNHEMNRDFYLRATVIGESLENGQTHSVVKNYFSTLVQIKDFKDFYSVEVESGKINYSNYRRINFFKSTKYSVKTEKTIKNKIDSLFTEIEEKLKMHGI